MRKTSEKVKAGLKKTESITTLTHRKSRAESMAQLGKISSRETMIGLFTSSLQRKAGHWMGRKVEADNGMLTQHAAVSSCRHADAPGATTPARWLPAAHPNAVCRMHRRSHCCCCPSFQTVGKQVFEQHRKVNVQNAQRKMDLSRI